MKNNKNDPEYQRLRHNMKTSLSEYLKVDNQINRLQQQINDLKKQRNTFELSLADVGNQLNLEDEQLRYHTEVIHFNYETPKQGLSNNIIKLSLENYFNSTSAWRQYSVNSLLDILFNKIIEQRDIMTTAKKKNLKIKRVSNKNDI